MFCIKRFFQPCFAKRKMNSFFQTNIEKISLQKQLGISFSLLLPLVLLAFSNPIQSSQKKYPSIFCHFVYFLTLQIMFFRNFSEYLWLRYPCVHRSLLLGPLFMREIFGEKISLTNLNSTQHIFVHPHHLCKKNLCAHHHLCKKNSA